MHVDMGWICPMWPSTHLVAKRASLGKKPCSLAVPLIKAPQNCGFSQKIDFFRPTGVPFAVCELVVIFRG